MSASIHQHLHAQDFAQFTYDCNACCGLCCSALYFSSIDGFPYDKPQQQPCRHLLEDYRCERHACLWETGCHGCVQYDCFGAGNYITSYMQTTWKKDPTIFLRFQSVQQLHQMLFYLTEASTFVLPQHLQQQIIELQKQLMLLRQQEHVDVNAIRNQVNPILKQAYHSVVKHPIRKQIHVLQKLCHKNLDEYDFSMSVLIGVDFSHASMKKTCFLGSDVRNALVFGCDLKDCIYLTQGQLNQMQGDVNTQIPWYLERPKHWKT